MQFSLTHEISAFWKFFYNSSTPIDEKIVYAKLSVDLNL